MKKIGAIISLSIVGILIALTIILSVTTLSHKPNIAIPDSIEVRVENKENKFYKEDENVDKKNIYNKITSLINDSFTEKTFTSILNGNIKNKSEIVLKTDSLSTSGGSWIRFIYGGEGQTLKQGKQDFLSAANQIVKYESIYFNITDTEELSETLIYIVKVGNSTHNQASYHFKTLANFSELYSYMQDLYMQNPTILA